jgi:hypothetical protein
MISHDIKLWRLGRHSAFEGLQSACEKLDAVTGGGRGGGSGTAFWHREVQTKADEGLGKRNMVSVFYFCRTCLPELSRVQSVFSRFAYLKLLWAKRVEKCQST